MLTVIVKRIAVETTCFKRKSSMGNFVDVSQCIHALVFFLSASGILNVANNAT